MTTRVGLAIVAGLALAAPARAGDLVQVAKTVVEPIPYGTVSAGVAILELAIDAQGQPGEAQVVKDLAPYTGVLRDSVRQWSFSPAREGGTPAPAKVLVVGLFRPAMLLFPKPEMPRLKLSADGAVPLPTGVAVPPYPSGALGSAYVVVEATVGEGGAVTDAHVVGGEASAFDAASTEAARGWSFQPALQRGKPVAARVYFVFAFRAPTT